MTGFLILIDATGWRYSALVDGSLKEAGTSHWSISAGATNSSGFTALPGGNRDSDVGFNSLGYSVRCLKN